MTPKNIRFTPIATPIVFCFSLLLLNLDNVGAQERETSPQSGAPCTLLSQPMDPFAGVFVALYHSKEYKGMSDDSLWKTFRELSGNSQVSSQEAQPLICQATGQLLNRRPLVLGNFLDLVDSHLKERAIESLKKVHWKGEQARPFLIVSVFVSPPPSLPHFVSQVFWFDGNNETLPPVLPKVEDIQYASCPGAWSSACLKEVLTQAIASTKAKLTPSSSPSIATPSPPLSPHPNFGQIYTSTSFPAGLPPGYSGLSPGYSGYPFSQGRSASMKAAYGVLGANLALSVIASAVIIGINWGTDLSTIDLGSDCGPRYNQSCGKVVHDFKSGVWISLGTVAISAAGLSIVGIVEHTEKKKKLPLFLPQSSTK